MTQRSITETVDAHAPGLLALPGVVGVAVGALAGGAPCVRVYVAVPPAVLRARLPAELDGWPVVVEQSGEIRPLGGR